MAEYDTLVNFTSLITVVLSLRLECQFVRISQLVYHGRIWNRSSKIRKVTTQMNRKWVARRRMQEGYPGTRKTNKSPPLSIMIRADSVYEITTHFDSRQKQFSHSRGDKYITRFQFSQKIFAKKKYTRIQDRKNTIIITMTPILGE